MILYTVFYFIIGLLVMLAVMYFDKYPVPAQTSILNFFLWPIVLLCLLAVFICETMEAIEERLNL